MITTLNSLNKPKITGDDHQRPLAQAYQILIGGLSVFGTSSSQGMDCLGGGTYMLNFGEAGTEPLELEPPIAKEPPSGIIIGRMSCMK